MFGVDAGVVIWLTILAITCVVTAGMLLSLHMRIKERQNERRETREHEIAKQELRLLENSQQAE